MLIRKGYKYRLKTKPETEQLLRQYAGCCRFVWNKALALQTERLNQGGSCLSYNQLAALLTVWKEEEDTRFLKQAPSQSLQQSLMQLDRALKDAFDRSNPKRFPRFKKRGLRDSFRYPQGFKLEGRRVFLPKIGWVGYYRSRDIDEVARNLTVSRRGAHWYVSIQTEKEVADPIHPSSSAVGIDLGVARFATLSDGTIYEPLNSFRKLEAKLAREQRKLARKVKFSSNWYRQKARISRIHAKISDCRSDYLHKASTAVSKNHAVVVLEALKVAKMSKSARGTVEQPGRNVRAKSGLNKAILDQGWYEFRRQLEYKQAWRGGKVVIVLPQNTSRRCPACGLVSAENHKTQDRFACLRCGYTNNADEVAAVNIMAAGQAVSACGEWALAGSLKQEPAEKGD